MLNSLILTEQEETKTRYFPPKYFVNKENESFCSFQLYDQMERNEESTGKSFTEALILASINPKYNKRLFIELQLQYMRTTRLVCTCCVST